MKISCKFTSCSFFLLAKLFFIYPLLLKGQTTERPNIIVLFADDMRAQTIHALGNKEIITPNLDKLVKSGVAFTHAYNMGGHTGAVCVSSRAMLLTGRNIHRLGDSVTEIPENVTFLGELLQKSGYQTYGIGKWHNGVNSYTRNFKNGDEIMFGGMTTSQWEIPLNHFDKSGSYDHAYTPADEKNRDLPRISDHIYKGKHSAEIFTDAAVGFLKGNKSHDPFFLYVAYTTPHDPRQMPEQYLKMYDNVNIPVPANFLPQHPFNNGHMFGRDEKLLGFPRKPEEVKKEIRDYYATISHLDAQIGRITETLRQSGMDKNTIVIFAGDNGLALGQHGLMGKQNLYEHTIGVPMIWSGPGIAKNKIPDTYCYLADIYPTICDLLEIPKPATVDGRSFKGSLTGSGKPVHDKMFFAFRDLQRAVSDTRFKLIEYHVKGVRTSQLFDLKTDPLEMNDLIGTPRYKAVVERLRKDLLVQKTKSGDSSPFWEGF